MTGALIRREKETRRDDTPRKTEAEMGVMPLQASGHQGSPAAIRSPEGDLDGLPLMASEGAIPADALALDVWPPALRDTTFLWFKLPSLQYYVTEVTDDTPGWTCLT